MGKSLEELKAEFLAKGGEVKILPPDATNGMKASDWKDATSDRGFSPANSSRFQAQAAERAAERQAEEVREAYHMGGTRAVNEVFDERAGR